MTREGLRRMLNLESLFYGLKSLLIGAACVMLITFLTMRYAAGKLKGTSIVQRFKITEI